MKAFYSTLLSFFIVASAHAGPQDVARNLFRKTVCIKMENTIGSGFVVKPGLVVTNYHVIIGGTQGYVNIVNQPEKYPIIGFGALDENRDLAILYVEGLDEKGVDLAGADAIEVGDTVYALGNPHGLEGTFSQGIISAIRISESEQFIQITAPISPGSSGGPIANLKGEIVGVARMYVAAGQNLNFAIPVKYVSELMTKVSDPKPLSSYIATNKPGPSQTLESKPHEIPYELIKDLSEQYYESGMWENAIEMLEIVISCEPLNAMAHLRLGVSYFKQHRLIEANDRFESLNRILSQKPQKELKHEAGYVFLMLALESWPNIESDFFKQLALKYIDRQIVDKIISPPRISNIYSKNINIDSSFHDGQIYSYPLPYGLIKEDDLIEIRLTAMDGGSVVGKELPVWYGHIDKPMQIVTRNGCLNIKVINNFKEYYLGFHFQGLTGSRLSINAMRTIYPNPDMSLLGLNYTEFKKKYITAKHGGFRDDI